jgi:hypothetical protein
MASLPHDGWNKNEHYNEFFFPGFLGFSTEDFLPISYLGHPSLSMAVSKAMIEHSCSASILGARAAHSTHVGVDPNS